MRIRARLCTSADGYITTPNGWPPQVVDPAYAPGRSHGVPEFVESCEAALMGRTTFEPALTNDRWPWPNLDVFVLASHRPAGTPDHVTVDADPVRLLDRIRAANRGRDVHLIGGPRTIETYRALGALDTIELIVLPFLLGGGMRLTDALDPDTGLELRSTRPLPGDSVEIVYRVRSSADRAHTRSAGWAPASQRGAEPH
ncbi:MULTISPECIES: dihydrofolate reductase family protein [unclassified Nocardia]|uniref:dihydrofolate reductase family protein n=1 Tax=unclassified Nocardia TaxID=2637762 RepID=UPI001CE42FA6|nr:MULTISPECIES: dihydrofolate reductase family protein [unclassified Nocardia]